MKTRLKIYCGVILCCGLAAGCSTTKNLPEEEVLYTGIKEIDYGQKSKKKAKKKAKQKEEVGVITSLADAYKASGNYTKAEYTLANAIAADRGIQCFDVLTGFKFIGETIERMSQAGNPHFLLGFEESYGCLIGTYARDKDAIVATMALCEAAAYYKTQGKTLWDAMIDMYEEFGYYKDAIQAVTMKGIEGLQKIQEIMTTLRQNPPAEFAGHKVTAVRDYKLDEITDLATGEKKPTGLPNSNVLYYELTDDAWVCVRPSGTEPKVKFYYGVKGTSLADADEKSDAMGKAVLEMVDSMK